MLTILLTFGGLALLYGLWFLAELIRYICSGEYETHRRLQKVTR